MNVELATVIYDRAGKPVDTKIDTIQGKLLPERVDLLKRYGYLQVKRIALKPGLYQVRVGVRDSVTESIGTAAAWVEVPDLTRGKLTISNIHLAERSAGSEQSSGGNTEGDLPARFRQRRQCLQVRE